MLEKINQIKANRQSKTCYTDAELEAMLLACAVEKIWYQGARHHFRFLTDLRWKQLLNRVSDVIEIDSQNRIALREAV